MKELIFYHKKTAEREVKMWIISGTVPAQRSCSPKLIHFLMARSQQKPLQHLFWQSVLTAVNNHLQPNNIRHARALIGSWKGGNHWQYHRHQTQFLSVTSAPTAAQYI